MKGIFVLICTIMLLGVSSAWSSDVSIQIQLGNPAPAPYVVSQPPLFLYPQDLGFYVAVGVPFGLFYIDNYYYTIRGGVWYVSPHYDGPWYYVKPGHLPPGLVKHKYRDVIHRRDAEYRHYMKDRDHYRGRKYHPEERNRKEKREHDHGRDRGRDHDHGRGRDH